MENKGVKSKTPLAVLFLGIILFGLLNCISFKAALADDEIEETKEAIDKIESKLEKEQQELNIANSRLIKNQQQVVTTKTLLQKTEEEIKRKEAELESLNKQIALKKKILAGYLQEMYFTGNQKILIHLAVDQEKDESFMKDTDQFLSIEDNLLKTLEDIKESKREIDETKTVLNDKKNIHEKLLNLQQVEQIAIKTDIRETEATISQLNSKLNKLRSELTSLLGKSISFDDVLDAAKFAAKLTGVRKDFILGMLVVESDLGRYTGGCTADKSKMSKYRLDIFKNICEELDYNWKKQKVSCPPKSYKGTGGAMGVAQFMPDTWLGYKSSIASATGHNPPDPWNLTDGVMAMALKLAKGGATKKSGECNAAKLYLSGTTSKTYNWYCEKVLYWADNYEAKLK